MAQPQETRRPPLRMVVESYVGVTGVTYAARADDRKDRMAELNTIPRSSWTTAQMREQINPLAIKLPR